jgi:spoIIIJ-associated protein
MGEGREFVGESIDDALIKGADYYSVSKEHLKFSVLEEEKDPISGTAVSVRIWVDRPDPKLKAIIAKESPERSSAVKNIANEVIQATGFQLDVRVEERDEFFEIDLSGQDRDFILDKHGEFLSAMQYIIAKILLKKNKISKKVVVDSNHFRQKKNEELIEIAIHAAEKVKKTGESYQMGTLSPYERRLVHIALNEVEGVTTFSTGDGFMKRITISPSPEK